jgi:tetratricopeptide (TPR) repeat protein
MQEVQLTDAQTKKFNEIYDKAWALQRGNVVLSENYYVKLGFFRKLKLRKSIKLFKQCLNLYPQSWQSAWAIGKANQALENDEEALLWFEHAYKIDQSNINVPREASLQCLNLGLSEKAVFYAKAAVDLDRNNDGLYANYALALLIDKKGDEALAAINKALEMNSQDQINKNIHGLIIDVVSGNSPYPDRIGPRG